jgi:hypothetical protein
MCCRSNAHGSSSWSSPSSCRRAKDSHHQNHHDSIREAANLVLHARAATRHIQSMSGRRLPYAFAHGIRPCSQHPIQGIGHRRSVMKRFSTRAWSTGSGPPPAPPGRVLRPAGPGPPPVTPLFLYPASHLRLVDWTPQRTCGDSSLPRRGRLGPPNPACALVRLCARGSVF